MLGAAAVIGLAGCKGTARAPQGISEFALRHGNRRCGAWRGPAVRGTSRHSL